MYLPEPAQLAAANVLSWRARRSLPRRTLPLPRVGPDGAVHLTSVLRVPDLDVPLRCVADRHYRYHAAQLHITVANLDRATETTERGIGRLRVEPLPSVSVRLCGIGCSPDTQFIRCVGDRDLARLRRAVRRAFAVRRSSSPASLLMASLAYVNIVRFDGPGELAVPARQIDGSVTLREMEIVRTDRYLSAEGTEVLATIDLTD